MSGAGFKRLADKVTIAYAAAFCIAALVIIFSTDGIVLSERGVIGGDFLVFYTAGEAARAGQALAAYDFDAFDAMMKARAPLPFIGFMWQYPPTAFFLVIPFSLLPYKAAYILWCAAGWAVMAHALRMLEFRGPSLRLAALSPFCLNVLDNGQMSLATSGLLFLAAYDPKRRWLAAGIAAGLLTIKPQLGLLLPVAFVACGAWRAIAVAAATAVLLHAPSLAVYGVEGWRAAMDAVLRLNADVTGAAQIAPPIGMTTLFAQLRVLRIDSEVASVVQYAFSFLIACAVFFVWRRPGDPLGKAALVGAGALLAAPYAYSYEMAALVLAGAYLVRAAPRAMSAEMLLPAGASLWLMIGPSMPRIAGLQPQFLITAAAFGFTLFLMLRPARAPAGPALAARAA